MLALVNNCIAEMTVTYPVSGGFVRLAGKWVDDAFGELPSTQLDRERPLTCPGEKALWQAGTSSFMKHS